MEPDLWAFESRLQAEGFTRIAGVDEAGRGPLAGPVVSAAVVLPIDFKAGGVMDSKQLSPNRREKAFKHIYSQAVTIGVGIVDAIEIDRINILQAARLSMAMAVSNLKPSPQFLLIDGKFGIDSPLPQQPVIKGDALSLSVAAASIVAKVSRDRLMQRYHIDYPGFGFDRHKGYPTKSHKAAIAAHGPCIIHRRSFKGVNEHLSAPPSLSRTDTEMTRYDG
jgi:ribonuclease HII